MSSYGNVNTNNFINWEKCINHPFNLAKVIGARFFPWQMEHWDKLSPKDRKLVNEIREEIMAWVEYRKLIECGIPCPEPKPIRKLGFWPLPKPMEV